MKRGGWYWEQTNMTIATLPFIYLLLLLGLWFFFEQGSTPAAPD
jgi:hypothetical protein